MPERVIGKFRTDDLSEGAHQVGLVDEVPLADAGCAVAVLLRQGGDRHAICWDGGRCPHTNDPFLELSAPVVASC